MRRIWDPPAASRETAVIGGGHAKQRGLLAAPMRASLVQLAMMWALALALLPLISSTPAAGSVSPSVTDYLTRSGDQVVTVPNGTYSGGTGSAPHPATNGPYRGWLVLVAQSPRGVVVDMSQKPLVLDNGTSRVLFVG